MHSVQSIPISKIRVVNPRLRNKKRFSGFVENVARVGLKKPITVRPRADVPGEFDLVCGQGRMEAYLANGQIEVPALVLEISEEDGYLMSLVENIARRKPCTLDLAEKIVRLEQLGHSSINVTVDLYGHVRPGENRAAVDRLAAATGAPEAPFNFEFSSTSGRTAAPRGGTQTGAAG